MRSQQIEIMVRKLNFKITHNQAASITGKLAGPRFARPLTAGVEAVEKSSYWA
jgi:hypothetical protein